METFRWAGLDKFWFGELHLFRNSWYSLSKFWQIWESLYYLTGAFLIPYILCVIVGAIPMFVLEIAIGQYTSQGAITCWNLVPLFKGNDYCIILLYLSVTNPWLVWYNIPNVINAWLLWYNITSVINAYSYYDLI